MKGHHKDIKINETLKQKQVLEKFIWKQRKVGGWGKDKEIEWEAKNKKKKNKEKRKKESTLKRNKAPLPGVKNDI